MTRRTLTGMSRRVGAALALVLALGALPQSATSARPQHPMRPVVVAVVEPGGLNILHEDFISTTPIAPIPPVPTKVVALPQSGSFEERREEVRSGALGDMKPGVLYQVEGTRIVGIYTSGGGHVRDIYANPSHGTASASAAVGRAHGTYPEASLVYVPDTSRQAWEWLARQRWIDIISTSYAAVGSESCPEAESISKILDQGRLVFSAIGNGEQAGAFMSPSGLPGVYQVGGVDDDGRPYLNPMSPGERTPNRPYETGDRYSFAAADAGSLNGSTPFGGTSGAAPSTAGRAASLIAHARELLRTPKSASLRGNLAIKGRGARAPSRGPLADGDLTAAELVDILHGSAIPSQPASPLRYLTEGYGALNEVAIGSARRVLSGTAELPERPADDTMHERVEAARAVAMSYCG